MNYTKKVIDDWDPIDLLSHAPDDEYHTEIEEIQHLLLTIDDSDKLAEGILKVFVKSFGKEVFNKDKEDCKLIAQVLLSQKAEDVLTGKTGDGSAVT